jgi:hypothetical protein
MKRTAEDLAELKAQATELRMAGIGGNRIAKELGISGSLVAELLRDVPATSLLTRPTARDATRAAAVLMREEGRTYNEIRDELGVSKSSLSGWLSQLPFPTAEQRAAVVGPTSAADDSDEVIGNRATARALRREGWLLREIAEELGIALRTAFLWTSGVPIPARAVHGRSAEETRAMARAYWDKKLAERETERQSVQQAGADRVGDLTPRELELVAVTAYWCEGAKSKPWARKESLKFINSDPDLIRVFLQWLRLMGVGDDQLYLSLSIHESADVPAAEGFWSEAVGLPLERFSKATLKRHNPKTVRKNTGDTYVGCLVIGVRQSRLLYQQMTGVWNGLVVGAINLASPPGQDTA